jgi:hypothetical protein
MMSRCKPAVLAIVLVVLSGIVHGYWTDRWVVSPAAAEAAARLEKVPLTAGNWRGEELPVKARETEAITGHLYRRYVHRETGQVVTVALVSGLPGPVAIHTPDVCYRAGGYRVEQPIRYKCPAAAHEPAAEFLTADLHKTKAVEELHQRIFWSWNAAGAWTVPGNPRVEFAARPVLYKIYLIREMSSRDDPLADDPCIDLLRHLLPQLRQTLFPRS